MSSVPQFAARGITKSFGGRSILRGTDLDVEAGSRIGILGPNGGGKSTLMRILAGLDEADAGTVTRRRGPSRARSSRCWRTSCRPPSAGWPTRRLPPTWMR